MNDLQLQKKDHLTRQAKSVLKRTAQDIIELSQICHEYHQEFGYQEYIGWIKDDLGISKSFGCNLLNVFDRFGVSPNFGLTEIQPSVLLLISEPSTPENAIQEVLEKASNGEQVKVAEAKEIIEKNKKIAEQDKLILDLRNKIIDLRSQIPTDDVLKQIEKLKQELQRAQNKPPEIKEPEDYNQLKQDIKKLESEKQTLKQKMEIEVNEKVKQEFIKLQAEIDKKKSQAEYYEQKIKELEPLKDKLIAEYDDIEANKSMLPKIEDALIVVAGQINILHEDVKTIPDEFIPKWLKLAEQMEFGAKLIRKAIGVEACLN
jgi:predicted  nucleic acid-binding Zn-ribbon protein